MNTFTVACGYGGAGRREPVPSPARPWIRVLQTKPVSHRCGAAPSRPPGRSHRCRTTTCRPRRAELPRAADLPRERESEPSVSRCPLRSLQQSHDDTGLPAIGRVDPGVRPLTKPDARPGHPLPRHRRVDRVSEDLARHGVPQEQLGTIVRRVIGGSIDIVTAHGGDAIAFGGDAITVTFADHDAARAAADEVVALVRDVSRHRDPGRPGRARRAGGISGGSVTSFVCACASRHVVVHLGDGLDRAVAAADRAGRGEVVVDEAELGVLTADTIGELPAWAPRVLHPVTAARVAAGSGHPMNTGGSPPPSSVPAVEPDHLRAFVVTATDAVVELDGDVLQCTGGDKGIVLIAVFGVPVAHPDDPSRAVHAVDGCDAPRTCRSPPASRPGSPSRRRSAARRGDSPACSATRPTWPPG